MSGKQLNDYISKENDWMIAIATDNAAKVDIIIQNPPSPSTKYTLLHTQLSVLSPMDTTNQTITVRSYYQPFHFAVVYHAIGVGECMVQHGVDDTK